ncbi:MAG: type restriction enzyme subunit [Patescibacteria group bacterium]|nr:type restriction enzyme subunit [Patescibacteria group bacterium]
MNLSNVDFDEAKQSQLPLVELLVNMGYIYLSREEALTQRGGDTSKFILHDIARQSLMSINSYETSGQELKFSEADVAGVVEELESIRLEGLIDTSKEISHMIMPKIGGKTIEVFADGRRESRSFRYIDFSDGGKNNQFHVTVEYKVTGKETIRCDVVCFVNGIPLAVIENKKSGVDIQKAIAQLARYQSPEHVPKLFTYAQLLVAANGANWLYGTTGTPAKFYANWREKDISDDELRAKVSNVIAKPIDTKVYAQLLKDLNGYTHGREQLLERHISEQDIGAYSMLRPERLLDIAKNYVFYDGPIKKVARYQQYFAIHKMLRRIHERDGSKRRGGIVWHTQGSGKSLTMVMFIRALVEDPGIENPRVVVVTDRKDLDRQIRDTLRNAGLKKKIIQAQSGQHLLQMIKDKESGVITTLVQKFGAAANAIKKFTDDDPNIFVLVDEAHRSHGRASKSVAVNASEEMKKVIPNASFIAFTGTPLLKDEKSQHTWGNFIDKYTIDDALQDKIVLPLIYEGRYIPLHDDAVQIDRRYDRVSEDLTNKQKYILQKRVEKKVVTENPDRIREICYDVQKHYTERFQGTGLKAQLVAPSKYAALVMQKFFEREGKIQTALVVSDENGEIPEDNENRQEVADFLKQVKANHQSLQKYEEAVIESFTHSPEGIEIVIVVDKLLTGFDAPRNTVLYLAKELKDHNLLQAIARVNRLFDNENPVAAKTSGFIIDYSENAVNIHTAMELFGNYEPGDVESALIDVDQKVRELEAKYGELTKLFEGVPADSTAMIERLRDDPTRVTFNDTMNQFLDVFAECLSLESFADKFGEDDIRKLKMDAKKFQELKKSAALQFGDQVDLHKYQLELVKILDENIRAGEAEVLTGEIEITNRDKLNEAIEELGSDTSKAEAIAAQTERRITERRNQDEALYDRFSKRIKEILEAMRAKKMADVEALKQLRLLDEEVEQKKDSDLPETIKSEKGADIMHRNLKDLLFEISGDNYNQATLALTRIVNQNATVDWWRTYETKRQMRSKLDDYLYEDLGITDYERIDKVIDAAMNLAENNHHIYGA